MEVMIKVCEGIIEDVVSGTNEQLRSYILDYAKGSPIVFWGDVDDVIFQWNDYSYEEDICTYFYIHTVEELK